MVKPDYAQIRTDYRHLTLVSEELDASPMKQLNRWLKAAIDIQHPEATAIALATVTSQGQPQVRMVLAKDVSEQGVNFFTNYNSPKGQQLAENPLAAITFFWMFMERQVRLEGAVEKLPAAVSDAYFATRPRDSQIGAWASPQSEEVKSHQQLEKMVQAMETRFKGQPVPRPPHWGGYILKPQRVEFWQGRPGRMHDRFEYRKTEGSWRIRRLAP